MNRMHFSMFFSDSFFLTNANPAGIPSAMAINTYTYMSVLVIATYSGLFSVAHHTGCLVNQKQ